MKVDSTYFRLVEYSSSKGLVEGIKILKPSKWKDIIFHFDIIKIGKSVNKKIMSIEVDFKILQNPKNVSNDELYSIEFDELIQGILQCML